MIQLVEDIIFTLKTTFKTSLDTHHIESVFHIYNLSVKIDLF